MNTSTDILSNDTLNTHKGMYMQTEKGNVAHVLADPNMSKETESAIAKMIDLAYQKIQNDEIKTEPIDPLNVPNTNAMMKEWQQEKDKKFFDLEAKVKELLLFTQNNGTVINGFRTEKIIKDLKEMVAW